MFGSELCKIRNIHKLSQGQLAKKIGLKTHQSDISDWENGKNRPTNEQAIALAKFFNHDKLLVLYKYTSPAYLYLMKKYFPGVDLKSHRDLKNLVGICSTILDMVGLYAEVLGKTTIKDERYYSDVDKLKVMTSRLAIMAQALDDIADDFKVNMD